MATKLWAYVQAGALAATLASPLVHASTVVTFDWVPTSDTTTKSPPTPQTGFLTLTLPNTITSQTFNTGNLGTAALTLADITGFSYTYSDGLTVGLANLNLTGSGSGTSTISASSNLSWYSSYPVTPAGGPNGIYLLTGFTLKGSKVFTGDPRAATFQIANAAGTVGPPSLVSPDANTITPFAGQGVASNDAGYWELQSFVTAVPLPAGLPLLLSGVVGLGALARRRRIYPA